MTALRQICFVTGGRADYGYVAEPARLLAASPKLKVFLVATGQHLTPAGRDALAEIAADGHEIAAQIDMQLSDDSRVEICKAMGRAVAGFADALNRLSPDLLCVVGDRYEILAAVEAALLLGVPVAHLAGGDITEGAFDDAIRHAITKMSHLHFPTHEEARRRILQMGENPAHVHCVGSTSIDRIARLELLDRKAFFDAVQLPDDRRSYVITFHPVTVGGEGQRECVEMLAALDALGPDVNLIFTGVNADPHASEIAARLQSFCSTRPNSVLRSTLGQRLYFSALRHCDAVIGNSSSGIYEAPSFRLPTVNIGDRQKGRYRGPSVIDAPADKGAILQAIETAARMDRTAIVNPYGDGKASNRISDVISGMEDFKMLNAKHFFSSDAREH